MCRYYQKDFAQRVELGCEMRSWLGVKWVQKGFKEVTPLHVDGGVKTVVRGLREVSELMISEWLDECVPFKYESLAQKFKSYICSASLVP